MADLGLEDAEELYARAKIGFQVLTLLQNRKLKQGEVGALLDIKPSEATLLMRGRFHHFSVERLLTFLKKLDQEVTLPRSQRLLFPLLKHMLIRGG